MICKLTNDLRQEINNAGLAITDSSMRVVQRVQEANYKIMLGYPINKIHELNSTSDLVIKKMIPGKLLTGTVYGGPASITTGMTKCGSISWTMVRRKWLCLMRLQ
jgi:hypothetical protein